ncbi:MAG: asparagine synthase (glutamine-hydrolyzing) [Candidatus Omnitrophica bacterium]|nr:asparagine synthase (glutamine-hydrolyzing) [Candidatus Omnitrophota bacterium]MDD5660352.1 asparagine synthase (glutamine-hydrolyzing) [Candidatus Omnitrophota bacterium]
MCGITGFIDFSGIKNKNEMLKNIKQMRDTLTHRGPDDSGVWVNQDAGVSFGHRRLSIVDLSEAGHQPMVSKSGRYVIVLNGEIYNHLGWRKELGLVNWRGHSDTETLLEGFEKWGIEGALKRTIGMFAIALWDDKKKMLTLARDRIGEKPLYYGFQENTFLFGSELKALRAHPDFIGQIDRNVLCLYLRHSYVPSPYSIYMGIKKLPPGSYIQFPISGGLNALRTIAPIVYWNFAQVAAQGVTQPFTGNDTDAITALDKQLRQAISLQMIADVPLGAFLSGGVDSSTIVALMQAESRRPVKTFSIGFNEKSYNEAGYAKAVAQHLGTDHTELYLSAAEAMQVIPRLGVIYDEPFADSSQIPTFLVSQMAGKYVKVSLSGDAGDELFCGYNRYALVDIWKKITKIPFRVRRPFGRLLRNIEPSVWESIFKYAGRFFTLPSNMEKKLEKFSMRLENVDSIEDIYYSLVSGIANPDRVVLGAEEPVTWLKETGLKPQFSNIKLQMMYMDTMTYLPDDILTKVDRAAMSNSLETRVPFLDHRVISLAWLLPLSMKIRNGQSKWILNQVLYKYVPKELIHRPKMGFSIPIGDWMRGPLRDWIEALLGESRLRQEGFFDSRFIRLRWQEHLCGKRDWQHFIWTVLMFQEWLEEQGVNSQI